MFGAEQFGRVAAIQDVVFIALPILFRVANEVDVFVTAEVANLKEAHIAGLLVVDELGLRRLRAAVRDFLAAVGVLHREFKRLRVDGRHVHAPPFNSCLSANSTILVECFGVFHPL